MITLKSARFIGAICVVLDGILLATICVEWKIRDVHFERLSYLIACMGAAAFISIAKVLSFCAQRPERFREGAQVVLITSVLEATALAVGLALLLVPTPAVACMRGEGLIEFCRSVVGRPACHGSSSTEISIGYRHRYCRSINPVDALDWTHRMHHVR